MSQLNETQLAQFKEELNIQQAQIRLMINNIFNTSDHTSDQLVVKKLTNLSTGELIEFSQTIDSLNHSSNIEKLKRVNASLVSIELGLFGLCSDCEIELSFDLLAVSPTIQRCPNCENKYQKQRYNKYRL